MLWCRGGSLSMYGMYFCPCRSDAVPEDLLNHALIQGSDERVLAERCINFCSSVPKILPVRGHFQHQNRLGCGVQSHDRLDE